MPSTEDRAPSPPGGPLPGRGLLGDPLAPILALGKRARRSSLLFALAGTLLVHSAVATQAARTLGALLVFTNEVREQVKKRLHQQYDVDLTPPPPPPKAPAPEPEPERKAVRLPTPVTPAAPPPAPAQAGKVLTQEPDPNEPVDLTGDGFVTGNADRYAGGVTASTGTSKQAVRDLGAKPGGTGTGPAPVVAAAPAVDLSRPATPVVGGGWDCGFPPEAEGIDQAVVALSVTVSPEGRAQSVAILQDPGSGFGQRARNCALRKPFTPALDKYGHPITASTAPFTVRFTR